MCKGSALSLWVFILKVSHMNVGLLLNVLGASTLVKAIKVILSNTEYYRVILI